MVEDVLREMGYDGTQAFWIHLDPRRPQKSTHVWLMFSTCFWIVGSGNCPTTNVAEEWTSTYRARGAIEFKDLNYYQAWLPMTYDHHDSGQLYVSFWKNHNNGNVFWVSGDHGWRKSWRCQMHFASWLNLSSWWPWNTYIIKKDIVSKSILDMLNSHTCLHLNQLLKLIQLHCPSFQLEVHHLGSWNANWCNLAHAGQVHLLYDI